ncbi:MAG: transcription-repair coupling factor [Gammaproteobacteria bacterium]|nr:transcription-repair coupling factor [Gammaproteobacteria bacterium]NNF59781.1 transcription-repair coupling factor [Gammaproteobacteria bacterium]NNM20975.1 transcription-repair coupling factor [Gammaproteobacteria bacterium]
MRPEGNLFAGATRLPPAGPARWGGLYGCAASLALVEAAGNHAGPLLVVGHDVRQVERLLTELRFFAGEHLPVLEFADLENLPYDIFSPHPDIISRRLSTLARLPTLERGIVVASAAAMLQRLPPVEYVTSGSLLCRRGDNFDLPQWQSRLERAGYRHVSQVMEHGEFAVRGSLIDIFPMGGDSPVRIDLFDDEIDSIRGFDPGTQLSGDRHESIQVLPAREFPMNEAAISGFRQRFRRHFEGDPTRSKIYSEVSDGITPGGLEYYLPLFFDSTATLPQYLPPTALVVRDEDVDGALAAYMADTLQRYDQRAHDVERPLLPPKLAFVTEKELAEALDRFGQLTFSAVKQPSAAANFPSQAPPPLEIRARAADPTQTLRGFLDRYDGRVLFVAESDGYRESTLDLLAPHGIRPVRVAGWSEFLETSERFAITTAGVERGLLLDDVALVVGEQLFGKSARAVQRRRPSRDPQTIIRDLTDLRPGAPVVHEEYGVGRFIGLQNLEVAGVSNEFLTLEYAEGDKLYVPVHALDLISRYTGSAPETAPLHKLGSDQWQRARKRAAERIRDAAAELLDVYARRAARSGRAFSTTESEYRAFVQGFPFEETPDQASAIEQVIGDLRSSRPMDRVICGDVGFGKTEVALRAAFYAVHGGAQVAVLVPTTLLAQQHLQTFRDRFADWPVRVEMLSRFGTGKENTAVIDGLAAGTVDIVIGTHKLLQRKVAFRDLGLVIIDEEHRFGVRHKEKLKELRAEVDVLTLTATPIPRTLNMAMGGVRDLSLITTPPAERLAVKTFVSEWNDATLREACVREIRRGGQVFVVHNRVQSIPRVAERIEELVPEADLRIAHGQMREKELEQVMLDFYHRRFSVLVCTTIIESGLDVPTANTIIIDRADHLGLAQLHQLRGRVGRSHHRAYAYLVTPPRQSLTADAIKRLEAVESTEDLGAGFALATHDLEIRGAGELLGEEQSGQIHEIGFSMYIELLERAVSAMKSGQEPDLMEPLHRGPEVDLHTPALLPDDYLPDVHMRLVLYKRIASATNAADLRQLQVEMIDRFGLLPDAAKHLFRIAQLKLAAAPLGIERLSAGARGGFIEFGARTTIDPHELVRLVQDDPERYQLDGPARLRFSRELAEFEDRADYVEKLLTQLAATESPVTASDRLN